MKIVLDTNILVRAHAKASGPAREVLQFITESPEHSLLLSPFLIDELERVLDYERIRITARLSDEDVAEYLGYVQSKQISEMVFPGPAPLVVPADPDDDPVVHTAVAGGADVLCTLNRHFYNPAVVEYCRERGVTIMTDLDLLSLLRGGG